MPGKRQTARRHPRSGGNPPIHPALKLLPRANKLIETGQHKEAAKIYEALARKAEDRGMARVAPNLYLQAGRAHLLAGDHQAGLDLLQAGLSIFAKTMRWAALQQASQQICSDLEQLGYAGLIESITSWTSQVIPDSFQLDHSAQLGHGQVPLRCPVCHAILKPGEVELLSQDKAECPLCGSQVNKR